jgi:hypothetical protein
MLEAPLSRDMKGLRFHFVVVDGRPLVLLSEEQLSRRIARIWAQINHPPSPRRRRRKQLQLGPKAIAEGVSRSLAGIEKEFRHDTKREPVAVIAVRQKGQQIAGTHGPTQLVRPAKRILYELLCAHWHTQPRNRKDTAAAVAERLFAAA